MADEHMQDANHLGLPLNNQGYSPQWFFSQMQQPGSNGLELSTAAQQPSIMVPQGVFDLLSAAQASSPHPSSTRGAAVSIIRPKTQAELRLELDNLRVATYLGHGAHCFNLASAGTVQRLTWIETVFHAHAASTGTAWPAEQLPDNATIGREMAFWRACWERHHRPHCFAWRETYLETVVLMDNQPRWKYAHVDYRQLGGLPVLPPGQGRSENPAQQATAEPQRSVLASPPSSPVLQPKHPSLPTQKTQFKPPGCSKRREMEKLMDLVDRFASHSLMPSLENAVEDALSGVDREEADARIKAGLREGAGDDEETQRYAEEVWAKYKELSLEDGKGGRKEEMGEDTGVVSEEMRAETTDL